MPSIEKHRARFRELHGVEAPPPLTCDFCVCAPTEDEARELATRHLGIYLDSVLEHYEVMGSHFATTKGYDAYAQAADVLRRIGESGFLKGFMQAAAWGSPDGVLKTLEARRKLLGTFELATSFRFGGIPYEKAEQSLRLFAREVLPVLKGWDKQAGRRRAAAA
jgi:alkanesulfonate monooxygenase SsuD/methylene tetrahydromethanopterin reductase-like flavin-dependent oxidoreductase (luciferase family)